MNKRYINLGLLIFALGASSAIAAEKTAEQVASIEGLEGAAKDLKEQVEAENPQLPKELEKAVIEADELEYDKETNTLTANKNVIFAYDNKEIQAKKIEYNQSTRLIRVDDGVDYKDSRDNKFHAKNLVINDTFNKGEMNEVKATMTDGSEFYSENLTVQDYNKYVLKDSYYSPCKPCEDGSYFWKFDADKIVYNDQEGRVYYRDVYLKMFDRKIAYLPYISHPTPFAKSKSGFLTPSFGQSSDYGIWAKIPYYYQPRENLDFTITPFLTAGDGPILILENRYLLERGEYEVEVSGAYPEEVDNTTGNRVPGGGREFRGHVKAKGNFGFKENWSWGFDVTRATDDTYLRRYDIGTFEDILKTELYVNRFKDRDYFSAKALSFQGLRATDDPGISPYVLPLIEAGKTYDIGGKFNQRFETNLNTMVLKRDEGQDSNRLIGGGTWRADYATDTGHLFNAEINTRADYYNVDAVPFGAGTYDGDIKRIIPTASLTWSYPLQKISDSYSVVVEPIVMAVMSPNGNNDARIPNEDSQNIEIYEYNLFQTNHISGYDVVEDGFRTNYGLRSVVSTEAVGDFSVLLGQNYRASQDPLLYSASSGMDDNYSDYVGRIVTGGKNIQSAYRFRLDKDDMKFKRNEVGVNLLFDSFQLLSSYTFIDGTGPEVDRQEVYAASKVKLTDQWSVISNARRNLDNSDDNGWIDFGGGVEFSNDCFNTTVEVRREFTRDRDIEPTTELLFKITLQNFGS